MLRSAAVLRQGAPDMSSTHSSCRCKSFNISLSCGASWAGVTRIYKLIPEVVPSCAFRFIGVMRATFVSLYRPRSI